MDNLSTRQLEAIPHIVHSSSVAEACRNAGITRTTFYKWMKEGAFKKEIARHRERLVNDGLEILKSQFGKAVDALVALLKTDNEGLRRQTAVNLIDYVLKLREITDIEGRLYAIEKALSEIRDRKSLNS